MLSQPLLDHLPGCFRHREAATRCLGFEFTVEIGWYAHIEAELVFHRSVYPFVML